MGRRLDHALVGGDGLLEAVFADQQARDLRPDVDHGRMTGGDGLQPVDRLAETPLTDEVRGLVVVREHLHVVLGVGQGVGILADGDRGPRGDVAERLQPRAILRRHRSRRLDRRAGQQGVERLPHPGADRRSRRRQVGPFAGIGLDVVQLVARRPDVPVAAVGQRVELAPAEVVAPVEGLGVQALLGKRPAGERRHERPAAQPGRPGGARQLEDRRHQIDVLDGPGHAMSRVTRARELHDERHADGLAVEKQPVLPLAVIAEALAVIRQQHDEGLVVEAAAAERRHQASHQLVGVRNLPVVGRVLRKARRRRVGRVRLVQVHEQEEPRRRPRVEPSIHGRDGVGAIALDVAEGDLGRGRRQRVVVDVEAGAETGGRAHDVGRDEPGRPVAKRTEHRGQTRLIALQREAHVVADAVLEREAARQDRRVGGQCLWRMRVGLLEHQAVGGQRVDGRRSDSLVAVDREMVRAKRVDQHEHDGAGERCRAGRQPPTEPYGAHQRGGGQCRDRVTEEPQGSRHRRESWGGRSAFWSLRQGFSQGPPDTSTSSQKCHVSVRAARSPPARPFKRGSARAIQTFELSVTLDPRKQCTWVAVMSVNH